MKPLGRDDCVSAFQAMLESALHGADTSGDTPWLIFFHGLSGLGKSTLLQHLHDSCVDPALAPVWLDFDIRSNRTDTHPIFREIERALRLRNLPETAWDIYNRECAGIKQTRDRPLHFSQTQQAQIASIINSPQTMVVNVSKERQDAELQAAAQQSEALAELLAHLVDPFVIFIDHWDLLAEDNPSLCTWMLQDVLFKAHGRQPKVRAAIAGDQPLKPASLATMVVNVPVKPLTTAESRLVLEQAGITNPETQALIIDRAGGNPQLLNLAVTLWATDPTVELTELAQGLADRAASEWLLDRIVKGLGDKRSQAALMQGVVLRYWTRDTLEAVCQPQEEPFEPIWYRDFTAHSFVQDVAHRPGWKTFDRIVREIQTSELWRDNHDLFRETHRRAYKWYSSAKGAVNSR